MKYIPTLSILKYPDPRLLKPALEVTDAEFEEAVHHGKAMADVMRGVRGWGLAAPQVGLPWRMFVVGGPDSATEWLAINPVINRLDERRELMAEWCLSFPGENNAIERPVSVHVSYTTRDGRRVDELLEGWPARIFQHEFDHLDGILFIEHWMPLARKRLKKRMGVKS